MPPSPLPPRRTYFPPDPPKKRYNRLAIYLAIGLALVFVPLTWHFQNRRIEDLRAKQPARPTPAPPPPKSLEEAGDQSVPAEIRQWHMDGVDGLTETQARKRFGKPIFSRDFNVSYGAFLGPQFGLKHYHLTNSPDYEQREKEAGAIWKYPEYNVIREEIWKLRESYITLWLHEPRTEISLTGEDAEAKFPKSAQGEWIVIDNYRVGQDLVKNPPVAATPAAAP